MHYSLLSSFLFASSSLALIQAFPIERINYGTTVTNHGNLKRQAHAVTSQKIEVQEPLLVESQELIKRAFNDPKAVVVDVRSPTEITAKVKAKNWINAPGSPFYNEKLACHATDLIPDKTVPVIVYCSSGKRAHAAADVLERQGYTNVHNAGGIDHLYFLPVVAVKHVRNAKIMP